jgi:hypothetical protein
MFKGVVEDIEVASLGGVGGLDHYPMRSGNLELMLLMLLLTRMMHGY